MVTIMSNGMEIKKIKTRDRGWTPHCVICRREFINENIRYQWRFLSPRQYPITNWQTSCLKCLTTGIKDVAVSATQAMKVLSQ